ncbi:hypothetical protein MXB_4540, partial [Myxobolus squamalis]
CIAKWLLNRLKKNTTCPQCNSKAIRSDIINLYSTKFSVVDNSLIEQVQQQLSEERQMRTKIESSSYHTNMKLNVLITEMDILKKENTNLKRKISILTNHKIDPFDNYHGVACYKEERNFPICSQNGCKIICIHPSNKLILISKISENPHLFPGYGICKLSIDNLGETNYSTEFVRLHKHIIRDMCISNHDQSQLLSCSLDKTIKITNLNSNSLVAEYLTQYPVWSCLWDPSNSNIIYAGLANGSAFFQLNLLKPLGTIIYMGTDYNNEYCVVSQRPNGTLKTCQQLVGELSEVSFEESTLQYVFNVKSTLNGGVSCSSMNRSVIYSPDNTSDICVAVGNQDECSIQVYNINDGNYSMINSKYGNIVDVAPIWYSDWHYLLGLSQNSCSIYRYII